MFRRKIIKDYWFSVKNKNLKILSIRFVKNKDKNVGLIEIEKVSEETNQKFKLDLIKSFIKKMIIEKESNE